MVPHKCGFHRFFIILFFRLNFIHNCPDNLNIFYHRNLIVPNTKRYVHSWNSNY